MKKLFTLFLLLLIALSIVLSACDTELGHNHEDGEDHDHDGDGIPDHTAEDHDLMIEDYLDEIKNFEECIAAGNPVMESYPRQCRSGDDNFVEEIME